MLTAQRYDIMRKKREGVSAEQKRKSVNAEQKRKSVSAEQKWREKAYRMSFTIEDMILTGEKKYEMKFLAGQNC